MSRRATKADAASPRECVSRRGQRASGRRTHMSRSTLTLHFVHVHVEGLRGVPEGRRGGEGRDLRAHGAVGVGGGGGGGRGARGRRRRGRGRGGRGRGGRGRGGDGGDRSSWRRRRRRRRRGRRRGRGGGGRGREGSWRVSPSPQEGTTARTDLGDSCSSSPLPLPRLPLLFLPLSLSRFLSLSPFPKLSPSVCKRLTPSPACATYAFLLRSFSLPLLRRLACLASPLPLRISVFLSFSLSVPAST